MPTRLNIYGQAISTTKKRPCIVATTANIILSGASTPTSIDGVNIGIDDRILVWQQNSSQDNGIYRLETSQLLIRDYDFNISDDLYAGIEVLVLSGLTYSGKTFYLTTIGDLTIGSSSLTFDILAGQNGTSGTSGGAGSSGASGTSGSSGTSGTEGTSGSSGTSGTEGTSGSSGTSGIEGTSGVSGSSGTSATSGSSGSSGSSGVVGGVRYNFTTSTTNADPGTGIVAYNSATISSVTALYIDNVDQLSNMQTAWYDTWDDSTTTATRGVITLLSRDNGTVVNQFQVTGAVIVGVGYYTIPVSYISGTLPANAAQLVIQFSRTGNIGLSGSSGTSGSNAGITSYTNPADNRVITSVSSTSINAEANLTFDGSILDVKTTAAFKLPVGTTAQRPATPTVGMIRWSTTISKFEFYNGTVWLGIDGTPTGIALGVVTFIVAAGGGGGGASQASWGGSGAGGAGGYRTSYGQSGGGASAESTLSIITATNYTVTVGAGGNGATSTFTRGGSGTNSVFSTITSIGGGGGAGSTSNGTGAGLSGGSGGGGAFNGGGGGAGTANQGYAGSSASNPYGGGGGGAGGAGSPGININSGAGIGVASTITGISVIYSRGGNANVEGVVNGDTNRGYGGSTAYGFAFNGGNGGSGVVIIRYSSSYTISNPGGGLTFSTISVLNDKVTTFTAGTGNIQFN